MSYDSEADLVKYKTDVINNQYEDFEEQFSFAPEVQYKPTPVKKKSNQIK